MEDILKDDKNLDSSPKDEEISFEDNPKDNSEDKKIPYERFKEKIEEVNTLKEELAEIKQSLQDRHKYQPNNDIDPDVELAISKLEPLLRARGFVVKSELEEENETKNYVNEGKRLSKELDGSDGRPAFDFVKVARYAKESKIYNLEAAYEHLHKKELSDWIVKNHSSDDSYETERPGESATQLGQPTPLTREAIAKKLASPGGKEWYEKNREKLLKAASEGKII
jgi:hypothetical protein